MIEIYRKEGWDLNPNDKIVNSILNRCEKNDGNCPCHHDDKIYDGRNLHCPCTDYRMKDECVCGLYVKKNDLKSVENEFKNSVANIK